MEELQKPIQEEMSTRIPGKVLDESCKACPKETHDNRGIKPSNKGILEGSPEEIAESILGENPGRTLEE